MEESRPGRHAHRVTQFPDSRMTFPLVEVTPTLYEDLRKYRPEVCPNGCESGLVDRIAGRWCPRCRGWLIVRHKPDGRPLAYIDTAVTHR